MTGPAPRRSSSSTRAATRSGSLPRPRCTARHPAAPRVSCYVFDGEGGARHPAGWPSRLRRGSTNSCRGHPAPVSRPDAVPRVGQELGSTLRADLVLPAFSYRAVGTTGRSRTRCARSYGQRSGDPDPDPTEVEAGGALVAVPRRRGPAAATSASAASRSRRSRRTRVRAAGRLPTCYPCGSDHHPTRTGWRGDPTTYAVIAAAVLVGSVVQSAVGLGWAWSRAGHRAPRAGVDAGDRWMVAVLMPCLIWSTTTTTSTGGTGGRCRPAAWHLVGVGCHHVDCASSGSHRGGRARGRGHLAGHQGPGQPGTLVAGFASGITDRDSIGGPPIAIVYQHRPAQEIRTTMAVYSGRRWHLPWRCCQRRSTRDQGVAAWSCCRSWRWAVLGAWPGARSRPTSSDPRCCWSARVPRSSCSPSRCWGER